MRRLIPALLLICAAALAQRGPGASTRDFVRTDAPVLALTHVRVIDGSGGAVLEDQTLVIQNGKIAAVGPAATSTVPRGPQAMERRRSTLRPGMVGLHDHMFFPMGGNPPQYSNMPISFTRLYLAAGVTTIRTDRKSTRLNSS